MKEAFKSLDDSRQYEIFTAAMIEFAEHGFKRASTNRIVKNAGMSKGMLYYYFENKQTLFDDTLEFAFNHIESHMMLGVSTEKEGFIERCARLSKKKYEYFRAHPEVMGFVTSAYFSKELNEAQEKSREELMKNRIIYLYDNIDMDRFSDDIDHATAIKLVSWTIDGYSREMEQRMKIEGLDFNHLDDYFDDFDHYLDALRKLYYKEEYQ
ncbi:TetR/AcrR family transcriptional regulator [Salinicoccus sp. HZC-1]|uniref:TetR/AcrR family transcriptional regulator n=1 Tax=Salinicoccus sp. HZC-1 TaxID=3385497 RepID=UPI00398B4644